MIHLNTLKWNFGALPWNWVILMVKDTNHLTKCAAATIGEKELLQLFNILKSTP